MIDVEQIPDEVWRTAMKTYHREVRRNPQQAWQLAMVAALAAWEGATTEPRNWRTALILPLTQRPST